jgi:hypothetical protein
VRLTAVSIPLSPLAWSNSQSFVGELCARRPDPDLLDPSPSLRQTLCELIVKQGRLDRDPIKWRVSRKIRDVRGEILGLSCSEEVSLRQTIQGLEMDWETDPHRTQTRDLECAQKLGDRVREMEAWDGGGRVLGGERGGVQRRWEQRQVLQRRQAKQLLSKESDQAERYTS